MRQGADPLSRPSRAGPPRHVAAWLRGCCYLAAGNFRQALQDARTALAYAPRPALPDLATPASAPPAAAANSTTGPAATAAASSQGHLAGTTSQALDNTHSVTAQPPCDRTPQEFGSAAAAAEAAGPPAVAAKQLDPSRSSNGWLPALLLAGEAYAGLGQHAQAVVHLAQVGGLDGHDRTMCTGEVEPRQRAA